MLEPTPDLLNNPPHMNAKTTLAHRRLNGFSLIELMIAVAVVGILFAVALPSFMDSIRKGRRSEAFTALSTLQQAQERWRSNRPGYTSDLTTATGLNIPATSTGGHYTISVPTASATATGYEAFADGSASSQVNDSQCTKLGVKVDRGAITYASCGSCTTFSFSATDPCWKR